MCGFIGKISREEISYQEIKKNNDCITCRGPDETKELNTNIETLFPSSRNKNFITCFFNRLSIIDLSQEASQPMVSKNFQNLILFNGEIYNHRALRKDLESKGIIFYSSHSDTETLLNGLSYYGMSFLSMVDGQFSISFLDSKKNKLYLIRDRMGQKPLYYKYDSKSLIFSSGLRPIALQDKNRLVDKNSLISYLDYGVVPSPGTIFKDIKKVRPAEIVEFQINNEISLHKKHIYWDLGSFVGSEAFDEKIFQEKFTNAIDKRLESDVPIATFSSGGIDSTSIIKNLHDNKKETITFSVGYKEPKYDESKWFSHVSNIYKTSQNTIILSPEDIDTELNNSIDAFEEPYSDPSTLPSYVISKMISNQYKVAISGDGGDELLFGYKRAKFMARNSYKVKNLKILNKIYPNYLGSGNNFMRYDFDMSKAYASFFSDKNFLDILDLKSNYLFENEFFLYKNDKFKSSMLTEYNFFLREMMMLKVDTTSMANSLEIRSPFVDHRLVEYSLGARVDEKSQLFDKHFLKNYLMEDFNEEFIFRKKMGFVFNLEAWVYQNIDKVLGEIDSINIDVNLTKINYLLKYKSRINAQRLWKLYFLSIYLNWFNNK